MVDAVFLYSDRLTVHSSMRICPMTLVVSSAVYLLQELEELAAALEKEKTAIEDAAKDLRLAKDSTEQ